MELTVSGGDRDQAADGHGIAGVHRQVHQDLLELTGIGQHVPQPGIELGLERDIRSEEAPEHRIELGHGDVEREHARLQHLAPAEGQELAGEAGGALPGMADLLQIAA